VVAAVAAAVVAVAAAVVVAALAAEAATLLSLSLSLVHSTHATRTVTLSNEPRSPARLTNASAAAVAASCEIRRDRERPAVAGFGGGPPACRVLADRLLAGVDGELFDAMPDAVGADVVGPGGSPDDASAYLAWRRRAASLAILIACESVTTSHRPSVARMSSLHHTRAQWVRG